MKEIHVKSIPVYLCDPKKNHSCSKSYCHKNNLRCYMTLNSEYAVEGTGIFRYFSQTYEEEIES